MSESARKAFGHKIHDIADQRTYGIPWPDHKTNGEEDDYRKNGNPTYIANFSKGLRHNKLGEVERESYESFLKAAKNPSFTEWEKVQLGTFEGPHFRLFNPLAGLTFPLQGPDPGGLFTPPPPRIDSAEGAFDEVEVYGCHFCEMCILVILKIIRLLRKRQMICHHIMYNLVIKTVKSPQRTFSVVLGQGYQRDHIFLSLQ